MQEIHELDTVFLASSGAALEPNDRILGRNNREAQVEVRRSVRCFPLELHVIVQDEVG